MRRPAQVCQVRVRRTAGPATGGGTVLTPLPLGAGNAEGQTCLRVCTTSLAPSLGCYPATPGEAATEGV